MAGMAHAMGTSLTGEQKLKFVVCGFCNLYFASHTTTNCKASSTQLLYLLQRFGHVASAPPRIMTKLWYCGTTRWSYIVTEQNRNARFPYLQDLVLLPLHLQERLNQSVLLRFRQEPRGY